MNKIIKYVGAGVLTFGMAASAFAATNLTFLTFPNHGPNITTEIGSTVQVKDTLDLTGSSELESISHQIVDNAGNDIGMPEVCDNVADRIVAGTFTVLSDFDTTGGTEGTFGIRTRAYGVTGPGTDNNCGGTVNDNQYYSFRVTLTEDQNSGSNANNTGGNNTGNSGGSGTGGDANHNGIPDWFDLWIASQQGGHTGGGGTSNTAKCATVAPYRNAPPYVYTSMGQQLQAALMLDNPHSIPALDVTLHTTGTVPMGFNGIQTHAALAAFDSMYHCI